jgi:pimeloyl-ACP methyl ester carboxylesterase
VTRDEPAARKVVSPDGTEIAYWATGEGSPLVLVHGTTSNHTTWDQLVPHLQGRLTLYTIDRRGRGASSDAAEYDLAREFEDIAAVVDHVAAISGVNVALLGHSFGGLCAYGAAQRTPHVRRLALYEGWPTPDPEIVAAPGEVIDQVESRLAAGDLDAALEVYYREVVHMSDAEIREYRKQSSWWQPRATAAHTIVREERATRQAVFDPEAAGNLAIPVLLLVGADSPDSLEGDPESLAAALPDARIDVLEGQGHLAHSLAPELFAERVSRFLHA